MCDIRQAKPILIRGGARFHVRFCLLIHSARVIPGIVPQLWAVVDSRKLQISSLGREKNLQSLSACLLMHPLACLNQTLHLVVCVFATI